VARVCNEEFGDPTLLSMSLCWWDPQRREHYKKLMKVYNEICGKSAVYSAFAKIKYECLDSAFDKNKYECIIKLSQSDPTGTRMDVIFHGQSNQKCEWGVRAIHTTFP
jgi:hypothetical protein